MSYRLVQTDIVALTPQQAAELLAACPKRGGMLIKWSRELEDVKNELVVMTIQIDAINSIILNGRSLLNRIAHQDKSIMVVLMEMEEWL